MEELHRESDVRDGTPDATVEGNETSDSRAFERKKELIVSVVGWLVVGWFAAGGGGLGLIFRGLCGGSHEIL